MERINPSAGESSAQIDNGAAEVLSEMKDKFDPETAKESVEQERQHLEQNETVKEMSPVTRIIRDHEGHVKIESEYLKAYRTLVEKSDYDSKNPEDAKLGRAIWDIGFSSALLDCDEDFKERFVQGGMDPRGLSPSAAKLYKKAMKGIATLLGVADGDKKGDALKQIEETGQVGEYFAAMYDVMQFDNEKGRTPEPYETEDPSEDAQSETDPPELSARFDALEQRFSKLIGDKGVDSGEVEDLYAEYSDLLKKVFDPKTKETIEERRSSLFSLADQLAGINKIINSMDD